MSEPTIDYLTIRPTTAADTMVPCAIRITAPADVDRVPTHFILLLDISESMMDQRKLENCKKCAILLLNFMNENDRISLITFGESAEMHLKRVPADESHKAIIKQRIQSLHCDGCTNLSAGLGYVREACEGDSLKAGLLILTDGHANRGVSDPNALRSIVSGLRESFSHLSVHCVAYGTDHNADLLRGIAEDSQSSYNIVNSVEDTAFAFGETLGGLMSCAYQNVKIQVPDGSVVHGPYKIVADGEKKCIRLGDIYAGTKPLVLFDIPRAEANCIDCVQIRGMTLPSLRPWNIIPVQQSLYERDPDIELTELRYVCTGILKDIREWYRLTAEEKSGMDLRITGFATKVSNDFYNGHPVATLLRGEVATLREMLEVARRGPMTHETSCYTAQHMTSLGLGRGFSSPMAPQYRGAAPAAPMRRQNAGVRFAGSGSGTGTPPASPPLEAQDPVVPIDADTSFMNAAQQRIASLMATSTQQDVE